MVLCVICNQNEVRVSVPGCQDYCDPCKAELKLGTCIRCKAQFWFDKRHEDYDKYKGPEFDIVACDACRAKAPCSACSKPQPEDEGGPECRFCDIDGYTCLKCLGLADAPDKYNYVCRDCRQAKKKIYNPYCSFLSTRLSHVKQYMVSCNTCKMNLCLSCATKCHTGHKVGKKQIHKEGFCECTCCPPSAPPEAGQRGDRSNSGIVMRIEEPVDIDMLAIQPASPPHTGDEEDHAPPPNKRKLVMQYNPMELEATQKKVKVYDKLQSLYQKRQAALTEKKHLLTGFKHWKELVKSLAQKQTQFESQKSLVMDMCKRISDSVMPDIEYLHELANMRVLAEKLEHDVRDTKELLALSPPTLEVWQEQADKISQKLNEIYNEMVDSFNLFQ